MAELEGDKSSSFSAQALAGGRGRGLFDTPKAEALDYSVSDVWNVSTAASLGATANSSSWFPAKDRGHPSPALVRTGRGSSVLKRRSGIDKLKRSMNELSELVTTTPGPTPRLSMGATSYTPGALLKGSFLSQPLSMFETPAPTPSAATGRATLKIQDAPKFTTPKGSLSLLDESGTTRELLLEESPAINQTTFLDRSRMDDTSVDAGHLHLFNESKLLEDPLEVSSRDLVVEFHNSFSSYHKPGSVLDLVASLREVCLNQFNELKKLSDVTKGDLCHQLMVGLNLERSTWELIHALYSDRVSTDLLGGDWDEEPMVTDLAVVEQSEKKVAEDFFKNNSSVRQAQVVVDWLEKTAHSNLSHFSGKIHHFADDVTWEHTLHMLRQDPDTARRSNIVTELDPDAPARQGKNLADLDAKDDQSLVKHLFMHVRAGQLAQAQELCTRCGQPWRAAALEGWKLSHDPNYGKSLDVDSVEATEGNQSRDLWKLSCWEMARDPSYSSYEKALYASLAGDIKNILPVCANWFDYVWAYFKVMVDVKTEQKLRTCSPATGQSREVLPSEYWNSILVPELIFQEIDAIQSEVVREESRDHFHLVHKYIILGDLENLIVTIHGWLDDHPNISQLRFMAHLVLFVKGLGFTIEDEKCCKIIKAYVQELTGREYFNIVALYTAQLSSDLQISCYTDLLRGISDPGEQRACLDLGKEAGLDIAAITKSVVEQIRNMGVDIPPESHSLELELGNEVELTKVDLSKIEVIKWLVFEETQRSEAVIQGNALMRQFLACKKLKAARSLFSKLPPDSVEIVTKNWQSEGGELSLPLHLANAINEYHCIQAYLEANDSFNTWFQHYHHNRPEPPTSAPAHADFRRKAEYEQKLKQYKVEERSWHSSLQYHSESAEAKLYKVLLFGEDGWMVDSLGPPGSAVVDEFRARQMKLLREMCIPQVCFLLLSIFNNTQQFHRSLRLADVIASEQYLLYQLFRQHELEKLLSLINEAALCTVDDKKSELGYPV